MRLSKKHIKFFSKCMDEEYKMAGGPPLTATFSVDIDREISHRAFGKRKRILVSILPFVFVLGLLSVVFPTIKVLPLDSGWFLPIYLGLMIGISLSGILVAPKIIGWLYDEQLKGGCRKFAKDVAEDMDVYFISDTDQGP